MTTRDRTRLQRNQIRRARESALAGDTLAYELYLTTAQWLRPLTIRQKQGAAGLLKWRNGK